MHWQKLAIVGVGLLGGSLGLAVRKRRLANRVDGFVRRFESISECEQVGAVDTASTDVVAAVTGADLVVLCTPLGQMPEIVRRMRPALRTGVIITDVGSVKASVIRDVEPLVAGTGAVFVGSHPMAGAEKTGVRAARPDLFEHAICVVTPTSQSPADVVEKLEHFWSDVGGRPITMSPESHDEFVSRSSHLPHVVAAELANYVLSPAHAREQALLCANGFRDTTRIASGSPEMWRDIALANRKNLARVLGVFIEDLQEFQIALERCDTKTVLEFFEQARQRRESWCAKSASPSPE